MTQQKPLYNNVRYYITRVRAHVCVCQKTGELLYQLYQSPVLLCAARPHLCAAQVNLCAAQVNLYAAQVNLYAAQVNLYAAQAHLYDVQAQPQGSPSAPTIRLTWAGV